MGNLLPALVCLPLLVLAILSFRPSRLFDNLTPLWYFLGFLALGWLAVNFLGLHQNGFMRRELARRLGLAGSKAGERYFVGIARPKFRSALDAHEDVGFLVIYADRLEFLGETVQVALAKKDIKQVRTRANPHTFVFLGRWISIEGEVAGTPVRMQIEPRERQTLLGNLFFGERLKQRISEWLAQD